jgi:hypothetical protein
MNHIPECRCIGDCDHFITVSRKKAKKDKKDKILYSPLMDNRHTRSTHPLVVKKYPTVMCHSTITGSIKHAYVQYLVPSRDICNLIMSFICHNTTSFQYKELIKIRNLAWQRDIDMVSKHNMCNFMYSFMQLFRLSKYEANGAGKWQFQLRNCVELESDVWDDDAYSSRSGLWVENDSSNNVPIYETYDDRMYEKGCKVGGIVCMKCGNYVRCKSQIKNIIKCQCIKHIKR